MKDAYEEEINRLKIELDQRDRQLASLTAHHHQQQVQQHQIQQQGSPAMVYASHIQQQQQQQQPPTTLPQYQGNLSNNQLPPTLPTVAANGSAQLQNVASLPAPPHLQQPQQHELTQHTIPAIEPAANSAPVVIPATPATAPAVPVLAAQTPSRLPAVAQPSTTPLTAPATSDAAAGTPGTPGQTPTATEENKEPVAKDEPTTVTLATAEEQESHYLVPYNQRSNHTKPIPPFLLDLDSQTVPAELKKQTDDYYILYNPALPRELDVELHKTLDHTSVVCCVRFSNDGEFLATGCNKITQVYRVSDGKCVAKLSHDSASQGVNSQILNGEDTADGATGDAGSFATSSSVSSDLYIRSVCFSPDGKFLATGAEDRLIRIWDIAQEKIVMVLQGHEQDIYSLDYFPSGEKLVSGSGDRTVRIWDLRTGQCSLTLSIEDGVTTVAVSPIDGKYIAAGSLDRAVRVWDSETGFLVERLDSENELGTGHKDSVYSVVFTRDGKNVISGSLDRSVKLWNLRGGTNQDVKPNVPGTCEVTYTGHKDFVLSVATTQNDEYILSGSKDRGVLFWDTKSGNPLLVLQGHRNSVISVAVANGFPLGPRYGVFVTGSGDCKARIWKYSKISASDENSEPAIKEIKE